MAAGLSARCSATVAGLVGGAFMMGQQRAYEGKLADYDRATLYLARYHLF